MKIEHVAMYVNDLEKAKNFFCDYFEGKANNKYSNNKTGFSSYFISFTDGSGLELMNDSLTAGCSGRNQIGYAHIAFSVGSKEKVNELTKRLQLDGYHVLSGPRVTGDGCYESCITDVEGNRIEITI